MLTTIEKENTYKTSYSISYENLLAPIIKKIEDRLVNDEIREILSHQYKLETDGFWYINR